mgnify:CR=1 FL=1
MAGMSEGADLLRIRGRGGNPCHISHYTGNPARLSSRQTGGRFIFLCIFDNKIIQIATILYTNRQATADRDAWKS